MKLGISTASFYSLFLTEQALEFIGRNGVKTAEVFLDSYSEYTPEFGEILLSIVKKYDLNVVSVHAMSTQFEPQLFSLSARQKADSWDRLRMVLAQAKKLGATNYVFHGAATLGGALKNAGLDRIAPITDEIAELCKTYGVRLCWENVSWCLFNTPEFATQMLARCKSDNLFFCLDIKQAIRSGYHPFEYLDTMGDRLGHVHLLDYAKNGDALNLYMPLEGNFDFEELRRRLCNIGFNGALMLECYSDLYTTPQDVVNSWGKLDEYYK